MLHRFISNLITNSLSLRLKVVVFFLIFAAFNTGFSNVCTVAKNHFHRRFETLQKHSLKEFNEQITNPENFPVWNIGFGQNKNEVIYIAHGFIGSPFEMQSTAKKFIQEGYTVVLDILPGHGLSGKAANGFTKSDLQKHIFSNLDDIVKCARQVHLIGFSTGSTLLHHYLQKKSVSTIASISLISPYYRPTIGFGDLIAQSSAVFISTLSVDFAYTISHFSDIKVAYLDPEHYHRDIPLDMTNEIDSLGTETFLTTASIDVPILVLTSSIDKIASPQATSYKIAQDFQFIKKIHFEPLYFAPHHLMADSVSPVAESVHQWIADFIRQH